MRMPHGGDDLIYQVFRAQPQAGGVDTGVAADVFALENILIDQKLHMVFLVVHQAQNAQGAGSDVQKLLHIFRGRKGQPGGADLLGKILGLEGLVSGHQKQVERGALPVAEHQVLADGGLQCLIDSGAGLHGHGCLMVDALIGDSQSVQ